MGVLGLNGVPYSKELQESIQRINEDLDSKQVSFYGKERRKLFDNEFGKDKIELAHKLIAENSEQIAEVLKNQSTNSETK